MVAAVDPLGPAGRLRDALAAYEDRPEQRRMAQAVGDALRDRRPLLVEAGTGTGKTLAYLLPAIESGQRVVISTGTRALQEQLARHDLPLLERLRGRVDSVVLKGVSNYLCRRKLRALEIARGGLDLGDDPELRAIFRFADASETGDRGGIEHPAEDHPLWARVTTTPDARLGPRCPFFERCFVTRARRQAERAAIVVVNHHLYFADLALRASSPGARVLPDHDAVIFDEAHLLEDVMTEHLGFGVSSARLALLGRDLGEALRRASGERDPHAQPVLQRIEIAGATLFDACRFALAAVAGDGGGRIPLPEDILTAAPRRAAWLQLDDALADAAVLAQVVGDRVAAAGGGDEDAERDALAQREELLGLGRRCQEIRDGLAALAEPGDAARGNVYWGELSGRGVALRAAPIDVSGVLAREVMPRVPTVIFTSATLTAAGSFAYSRARLGLPPAAVDEVRLDSPFDYARQAMLYVPRDLPPPGAIGFAAAAAARLRELLAITDGRAFVLFTSHRALREAEEALADLPWPLLVQGQAPPAALVERFRRTPGAVLLATGTFWAGVDVPGDALSLVVMDKLPFASPADPLVAARARRIEEAGGDAFRELSLPQAALTFKQGFGRLIRRRDDRGIVAVLDGRLLGKGYGETFLASLPAGLRRTAALEPLRRFFHGDGAGPLAVGTGVAPAVAPTTVAAPTLASLAAEPLA